MNSKALQIPFSLEVNHFLEKNPDLQCLFENCFFNTLRTTTEIMEDGSSFVFTGDIPAMWLRDSSAQVRHYLPFAVENKEIAKIIAGLIQRQMMYISLDPYANAFNKTANNQGHKDDVTLHNDWVWERKYEIDSLCYPVQLAYLLWQKTGSTTHLDEACKNGFETIIRLWKVEQYHDQKSTYSFERKNCPPSDTLTHQGKGAPTAYTGMTWSGFRPSDDACEYGYLVPANMFAVVVLGQIAEIAKQVYQDDMLAEQALTLRAEIDAGIQKHAVIEHPTFGRMYCYEVDGNGNYNLMDDANIPSLLSIPYLGYRDQADEVYQNTRRFILSEENPYFYKGKYGEGVGSPHTPDKGVWHIALAMQGLTSTQPEERKRLLEMFKTTHDGTYFMHESFQIDNPGDFTREWFAWANSLFAEFLLAYIHENQL